MRLPITSDTYFKEREGVLAVASALNDARQIWRETPNADVGIDAQIEYVDSKGRATGRLAAVQVKSGHSYLKWRGDSLSFSPSSKHSAYWTGFPIPVLLFIHDPSRDVSYWVDARRELLARGPDTPIQLPKSNTFPGCPPERLFSAYGPSIKAATPTDALRELVTIALPGDPRVTGLHLFSAGLTDTSTKLFVDLSLLFEVTDLLGCDGDVYSEANPLMDRYIGSLYRNGLIRHNFAEYLVDLDRGLQARFLSPLTTLGRAVRDQAFALSQERLPAGGGITEERFFQPIHRGRERDRFARVTALADAIRSEEA